MVLVGEKCAGRMRAAAHSGGAASTPPDGGGGGAERSVQRSRNRREGGLLASRNATHDAGPARCELFSEMRGEMRRTQAAVDAASGWGRQLAGCGAASRRVRAALRAARAKLKVRATKKSRRGPSRLVAPIGVIAHYSVSSRSTFGVCSRCIARACSRPTAHTSAIAGRARCALVALRHCGPAPPKRLHAGVSGAGRASAPP